MSITSDNIARFLTAQAGIDQPFTPVANPGRSIWRWEGSDQMVPVRLRSGPKTCGSPYDMKWFSSVDLNGDPGGSFVCRVWVDGHMVVSGAAGSFAEIPGRPRNIRLPRGTKGYAIDVEVVYTGKFRGSEVFFDMVSVGQPGGQQ